MATITDKKLDKYVHSKISNEFGLSVDDIAPKVTNAGRFSAWLGGNQKQIKEVLNAVKDEGVSPAFFASYEVGEGYNASWGWLNHTTPQGDYLQDARATAKWIVSQSKRMNEQPAWIDFANYVDFVPANVKSSGNKDFSNMKSGAIGRVVIAGTAAATWEVYYPNGLKAEYNGVQDYGAPLTEQYKNIEKWGGSLSGGGDGGNDDGGNDGGNDGSNDGGNTALDLIKKALTSFTDFLEDSLTWDIHSIGTEKFFSNNFFSMQKTFNNTYRLKMNLPLLDALDKLVNSIDTGNGGNNDGDDGGNDGGDDGNKKKYDTSDFKKHYFRFRYAKTANDFPPGYPYPSANGHHGNDYDYIYETLKSHVSGTVNGNNGHGVTVNDGGIGYDGDGMGWGNRIVIKLDDGTGRSVLYAHLNRIDVKAGDKIKVGQTLGQTGNTGEMTTGPHLHVELKDASNSNAASDGTIDPTPFIDKYAK